MTVEAINRSGVGIDLSPRLVTTATVVGSPADATETIVAQITLPTNIAIVSGVLVTGWLAWTYGTTGNAATVKIRRTNVSGTTLQTSGALNNGAPAATQLDSRSITFFDTAATTGGVYVMTLTVAAAVAASTVSAVALNAILF